MRFSLNLIEIYNNMANEYGEPLSDYMSYEEFVERMAMEDFTILRSALGDFLVVGIDGGVDEQ